MAYTTIDDPSAHFQTLLYTGDGNDDRNIVNTGNSDLQPDWLWIKDRDNARSHEIYDSSRGATIRLKSEANSAESAQANNLQAFQSDGFQVGSGPGVNGGEASPGTYVAWQWKANGGSTTNVDGTGTAEGTTKAGTYQANTTAGFSIITFSTGVDDLGDHRIQHGLGAVPHFIITKERDGTYEWYTYHHKGTDDNDYLRLNLSDATSDAGARNVFDGSDFTSTYFEMGNNNIVNDSKTYVAYCFTEIQGYSKFDYYTANDSADGPFVYTGFKPAWLMIKAKGAISWYVMDNKRDIDNPVTGGLNPDANGAEFTNQFIVDFLSNGFKIRNDNSGSGASVNHTTYDPYLYMAFAEQPFVTSGGVPCTAR